MDKMRERFKTFALAFLVLSGVLQFFLLIATGQEPVYVLPPQTQQKLLEEQQGFPPETLAMPIRMIAHLGPKGTDPDAKEHVLLRSSVTYYANIWSMLKEIFTAEPFLDLEEVMAVRPSLWNANEPSLELILCQPVDIDVYLDFLGVTTNLGESLEAEKAICIDRFYLSASSDDLVLVSDVAGVIYALPWKTNAAVLHEFLRIAERGVLEVFAVNVEAYGFASAQAIYGTSSLEASRWLVALGLSAERFYDLAPNIFDDPALLRVSEEVEEEGIVFEDNRRRLSFEGNRMSLEQTRASLISDVGTTPIWREAASVLRTLDLWPEDNFYYDGALSTYSRQTIFLQQAHHGRPVFELRQDEEISILSTLCAEGRAGELVTLSYLPWRLSNISGPAVAIIGQGELLQRLGAHLSETAEERADLPLLRDIYEAFLCRDSSDLTELVWVVECVDGQRFFFEMQSGAFIGAMSALAERNP